MNDAGKVAFTPKGDYSNAVTYEYLDTVVYDGNAYAALKTTTGNEPADDSEYWRLLARGGTSVPVAKEETTGVVKASSDIGVSDDGSMILETDYTSQENLTKLTSGESRTTFFGKIAKAVSMLISHISTSASTSVLGHVKYGTTSGTACQGNDKRLSDSRTPKSHASTGTGYGAGTTSNYGHVKLSNSSAVTDSTGLALPATEKNASIEGTLANQISALSTDLESLDNEPKVLQVNIANGKTVAFVQQNYYAPTILFFHDSSDYYEYIIARNSAIIVKGSPNLNVRVNSANTISITNNGGNLFVTAIGVKSFAN